MHGKLVTQFEKGDVATPFEFRHINDEVALCQRYFQKTYNLTTTPGTATGVGCIVEEGATANANRPLLTWSYPTKMRDTPTGTFYSTNSGTAAKLYDANATTDNTATVLHVGETNIVLYNATTGVAGNQYEVQITVDAEL